MRRIIFLLLIIPLALCACSQKNETPSVPAAVWPDVPEVASYDIQVTLDPGAKTLTGHETITYHNTTSTPIPGIALHLYLNAFRDPNSIFLKEIGGAHRGFAWDAENPGWIEVSAIRLADGTSLTLETLEDGTLARADLPKTIPPGSELTLEVDFKALLPKIFARTGFDEDFFMVGQWFPKLGVWQDAGWNAYPFHANSEFFADFGAYDVAITLPDNYIVGGAGLPTDTKDNDDGTQTVHYHAEGVIDFAWTASPDFKQAEVNVNGVQVLYLYLPEHKKFTPRVLDAAASAIQSYGEWYGPYPYARLTIVDVPEGGGGAGGMEYPTLITAGVIDPSGSGLLTGEFDRMPEIVVVHEIGHQWWQSMVAFNEAEEPWLDEGFTDYATENVMSSVYGPYDTFDVGNFKVNYLEMHRMMYMASPQVPMYGKAWELGEFGAYEVAAYSKPVLALSTLENILGEETMLKIMRTFFERYRFAHPTTEDFRQVAEEISGQDLTWFFEGLVYENGILNDTVKSIEKHAFSVERQGGLVVPVEIVVTFSDGSTQTIHWDGQEQEKTWQFPDNNIVKAEIDPQHKVAMDLQWSDNGMTTRMDLWSWLAINTRLFYQIQNWLLYLGGI